MRNTEIAQVDSLLNAINREPHQQTNEQTFAITNLENQNESQLTAQTDKVHALQVHKTNQCVIGCVVYAMGTKDPRPDTRDGDIN